MPSQPPIDDNDWPQIAAAMKDQRDILREAMEKIEKIAERALLAAHHSPESIAAMLKVVASQATTLEGPSDDDAD